MNLNGYINHDLCETASSYIMSYTKKPHRKSRAGCQGCKTRKIKVCCKSCTHCVRDLTEQIAVKCDEVHPQCTFCITHEVPCIYPSRSLDSRQKAQSRSQSPRSFSTEDSHTARLTASGSNSLRLNRQPWSQ